MVKMALRFSMLPAHAFPRSSARPFGRRRPFTYAITAKSASALTDDMQLFLATFVGGFLFMAVYLA
jgi:hypothetical protein